MPKSKYVSNFQADTDTNQNQQIQGMKIFLYLNLYLMLDVRCKVLSGSAHRTPNFTNPEFQFPQFKGLQSVLFFLI